VLGAEKERLAVADGALMKRMYDGLKELDLVIEEL
jgi:hypothetical protein